MNEPINLTPEETAQRLRLSVLTLKKWRTVGGGPRYRKFGRRVLYPLPRIEEWEREQERRSTTGG